MVQLFLSEPIWNDDGGGDAVKQIICLLKKLESVIWSLIRLEGRSEARLWLCNTIACLGPITPQVQCDLFVNLLKSKPRNLALAAQILRMIFEKRPHKAGLIIAKKSYMLEKFFKGNPRRILQWFDNFAGVGESEHRKGARAISQFAFVNRDICWEELEWKGKHGQSPAVVATKPHYFLDLDVQRTVENFIENVPEFWSSVELAESLRGGEILLTDTKFFIDCFLDLMYEEESKELWEIISDFLMEEPFSSLCHHLLIILEERNLYAFLDSVRKFLTPRMEFKCVSHPSYWLEVLLSMHNGCASIDELLLLNAVINQGRQLLRLVRDEEHERQKEKIEGLILEFEMPSSVPNASLIKECVKMKNAEALKWLGLQSWILHYRLSEECKNPESWETLFIKNGISFRKSNNYDLLHCDGFPEEPEFDLDDGVSIRARRKKKAKTRKKRRRMYGLDRSDDNELMDLDTSCALQGLQSRAGSWFLSTDGYSSSWNSVDLPEHLAKHCFSTWMKWVCSKWTSLA